MVRKDAELGCWPANSVVTIWLYKRKKYNITLHTACTLWDITELLSEEAEKSASSLIIVFVLFSRRWTSPGRAAQMLR